jgi:hypothetical protein
VKSEERLAQLVAELESAALEYLVMGGHAVRYYRIDRNTVEFDFVAGVRSTAEIRERLSHSQLLKAAPDGASWRADDFTRFEIGRLPDGREEWLEFWIRNHLLPDFAELRSRAERGEYGGRTIAFISLSDLIRSKETERTSDWSDVALLEEIRDFRNLGHSENEPGAICFRQTSATPRE